MVLEKSESLRQEGGAIGLQANAWKALDAMSVGETLRQFYPKCQRSSHHFSLFWR